MKPISSTERQVLEDGYLHYADKGTACNAYEADPDNPVLLWAFLKSQLNYCMDPDNRQKASWSRPVWITEAIATALRVAEEPSALVPHALSRVAHLARCLSLSFNDVVSEEDLAIAAESLKTFEALMNSPLALYERRDSSEDPTPDGNEYAHCHREAAIRLKVWRVVRATEQGPDRFAFLPGLMAAERITEITAAFDPLILIPEFQEWAQEELGQRRLTEPNSAGISFQATTTFRNPRPAADSAALAIGRLIAAQLVGLEDPLFSAMDVIGTKLGNPKPILAQMLAAGLDPNAANDHESLLHRASRLGDAKSVRLLLKAGANLTATDSDGETPVSVARNKGTLKALGSAK